MAATNADGILWYYINDMEKVPNFRIIGGASEKAKEEERECMEFKLVDHIESLSEQAQKNLERLEYPKTEMEFSLIGFANSETDRLMEESGVNPYDIPADNYHIIPNELFKDITGQTSDAAAFFNIQGIVFNAHSFRSNPAYFGAVALHETLHLKGHLTIEVEEEGRDGEKKAIKTHYREGVSVGAARKKWLKGEQHLHFQGLHEAIVSTQEKRSLPNLFNLPSLKKEKERMSSGPAKELVKRIAEKKGLLPEDFIWVGEKEDEYEIITYRSQRKALQYVCEEIHKQFPDRYQSEEDVFKEFLKAQFTGRLLPIAHLVEDTFGKGSFRMLGDMRTDEEGGVLALEALRKARLRTRG